MTTTPAPTRPLPPTPEQLLAVLDNTTTSDDGLTVLHLATAVHVTVPVGADRDGGMWRIGRSRRPDTGDIVGDGLRLVHDSFQEGDRYLDLSDPSRPARFVKVRRSGSRLVAFGSDLLVGGPQVVAEPQVDPAALVSVLHAWQDQPDIGRAGVVRFGGVPLLVEGSDSYLLLRGV